MLAQQKVHKILLRHNFDEWSISAHKAKVATPVPNVDPTLPLLVTSLSTLTSHSNQSNEDNMQHNARSFLGQQQLNNFASICGVSTPPNTIMFVTCYLCNLIAMQVYCLTNLYLAVFYLIIQMSQMFEL